MTRATLCTFISSVMALLESSRDISFFGLDEALVLSEDLKKLYKF